MLYCLLFCQFLGLFALAFSGEICYGKYGCFNNKSPFNRYFDITKLIPLPLPQSPAKVGTTYYVVSKMGQAIIDDSDVTKLQASGYDGSKKTIIAIHGYTGSIEKSKWLKDIKSALLDNEDINLIFVDWKEGAAQFYTTSVVNTRLVGSQVAELIKFLNTQTQNSPASFHVIGFSLGAHVAGYVGRRLQSVKLGRITGLDPAGLYFHAEHTDVRLDETDAAFVDVIHTDAGALGMTTRSGHLDFYPNGGRKQRGCEGALSIEGIACDHIRAPDLYVDSIVSQCPFRSYRCSNWDQFTRGNCMTCDSNGCPEMGHKAANSKGLAAGTFYLYTNEQSPFCVHRYVYVTFKTSSSWFAGGRNPRVRIHGTKGNSGEIQLEKRDLKRGSTERFVAPIKADLGTLTSIEVRNADLSGWKLEKVTIDFVDNGERYTACYDTWVYTTPKSKNLWHGSNSC